MAGRGHELLERLRTEVMVGDGAMGTMLYARGVPLGTCYDAINLSDRELVKGIHRQYVIAGAELIETNTFGANAARLRQYGLEAKVREINVRGAQLAREVAGDRVFVAGSVGPLGRRAGEDLPADIDAIYREQAAALAEGGVDLLLFETFLDLDELIAAIRAAKRAASLPVLAQIAPIQKGRTARGVGVSEACREALAEGVAGFGVNCGKGPREAIDAVERLVRSGAATGDLAVSVFPNAGFPEYVNGRYIYLSTPDYMAEAARRLVAAGAALVGGCCGTTPADIAAIRIALRGKKRVPLEAARARLLAEAVERAPVEPKPPRKRKPAAAEAPPPRAKDMAFLKNPQRGRPPVLVEVDPPRDLDLEKCLRGARLLQKEGADAVTVGDNPLAIMRMSNVAFAHLVERTCPGLPAIVHLSCRDRNLIGLQSELMGAWALGLRAILGITGDPASSGNQPGATSVYDMNSFGLVELMARMNRGEDLVREPLAQRTDFVIGVAMNPNGRKIDDQLRRLAKKAELGAHFVMTQPCFDVARIRELYERAAPLGLPIFLGLLPITSQRAADFLHNEVPGIEVPEAVRARFQGLEKEAAKAEGVKIACEIVDETFGLAHGYYIIPPFNIARNAVAILRHIRAKIEAAAALSARP
jgi:homocysteine S-methyltransferase